jgi:hypothetical protein
MLKYNINLTLACRMFKAKGNTFHHYVPLSKLLALRTNCNTNTEKVFPFIFFEIIVILIHYSPERYTSNIFQSI